MRQALVFVLISVVLLSSTLAQNTNSTAARQVRAADQALEKAWSTKDLEGAMKFYADNAITMEPGMPAAKGTAAIRKQVQEFFAYKDFQLHWTAEQVEVAKSADMAYTRGTFDAKFTDPSDKPVSERGKYITIWKKIGGEWKVVIDINNSDGDQ